MDKVLFFITCKKHLKNIDQLRPYLGEAEIKIVTDVIKICAGEVEFLKSYESIERMRPDVIVMFMAGVDEKKLWLMEYSLRADIPCVGVEEGNQLALNNGRVNHYFTPLDGLGAASGVEQALLKDIPVPYAQNIEVTGWGFFEDAGSEEVVPKSVLIFLSPLQEKDPVSNETPDIRERFFALASAFIERGYTVSFKPHPIEPVENLVKQLAEAGVVGASVVGDSNVAKLIGRHDVIVNRGNSQTSIEALYQGKKVLVYPMGIETIFDGASNLIEGVDELDNLLGFLNSDRYEEGMREVMNAHIPHAIEDSLKNIANFILHAKRYSIDKGVKAMHLSLLYFSRGFKARAIGLLDFIPDAVTGPLARFYKRPYQKNRFLDLKASLGKSTLLKFYLAKIYIDSLSRVWLIRRWIACEPNQVELPTKDFASYYWADTRKAYARIYGLSQTI